MGREEHNLNSLSLGGNAQGGWRQAKTRGVRPDPWLPPSVVRRGGVISLDVGGKQLREVAWGIGEQVVRKEATWC